MIIHFFSIFFCLFLSGLMSFLCSRNGLAISGIPTIYYATSLVFIIHLFIFIPSYLKRTEKFFDFTGMIAYLSVILLSLYLKYSITGSIDFESIIIAILVSIWSLRLGIFLFYRILRTGKDDRFSGSEDACLQDKNSTGG